MTGTLSTASLSSVAPRPAAFRREASAATVEPPAWVRRCVGAADRATDDLDFGSVEMSRSDRGTLATIRVRDARSLDADAMRVATAALYRRLFAEATRGGRHVVRIWNHIPGIHDPLGEERDRYRVFNAGRFDALCDLFGGREGLAASTPTASGVGHAGRDLVVHALATDAPGRPIENPAQVPAYEYSRRYGKLPPCFARATVVDLDGPTVLVAGTAAISGEDSRHPGDLDRQITLTLDNLRRLLTAAGVVATEPLDHFRDVRVYVPRPGDVATVREAMAEAFAGRAVECLVADLCRPELLVEIEGVAAREAD